MGYKTWTNQWDKVKNKTDYDICGENLVYWVKSRELPATMFRKIVAYYLFIVCKYPCKAVAAFLDKDHSTILHTTANYLQEREFPTTKKFFDKFETPEVLENVHAIFQEFLFKYQIKNKNPAFEEAIVRSLGWHIQKLGKTNMDKYKHVISDLVKAKSKLNIISQFGE